LEKNKLSMEKALKALVKEGSLMASMWEDEWLDIVYPWEILQANRIILESWDESSIANSAVMDSNVTIQGVVNIEEDVVIKAGAVLEGPCSIGKGTYIGNNSLIRSYTSVGSKCSVGYGVELKNCVVLDNSGIGRLSFVGDSVIGENVAIGAGCMTVNRNVDWQKVEVKNGKTFLPSGLVKLGAFVGDDVTIGAGNTIQPGTVVTSSPTNAPNFTKPEGRKVFPFFTSTFCQSTFLFTVMQPAPIATFSPITLSPTNDSLPIPELSRTTQFLSSTP
jgi:bifunctional UDP-N-acetylglucosamine pyrophosphorylase/glucosamine-1-phosphate N-acetyltransferase